MAIRFSPPNKANSDSPLSANTETANASLAPPLSYNQAKFYAWQGRINRAQYFAYPIIVTTIILLSVAVFVAILYYYNSMSSPVNALDFQALSSSIISMVLVLGMVIALASLGYFHIAFTKRRLNDLNQSGWWSVLLIIPVLGLLLNVYLLAIKGSPYYNRYGAPAARANTFTMILAVLLPSLLLLGLLSTSAIYQDYFKQLAYSQYQANQPADAIQRNKPTGVSHHITVNMSTASNVTIAQADAANIKPPASQADNNELKNNHIVTNKPMPVDDLAIQQNVKPILVDNVPATSSSMPKDAQENRAPSQMSTHASTTQPAINSDKVDKNTKNIKVNQALIEEATTPIFTER